MKQTESRAAKVQEHDSSNCCPTMQRNGQAHKKSSPRSRATCCQSQTADQSPLSMSRHTSSSRTVTRSVLRRPVYPRTVLSAFRTRSCRSAEKHAAPTTRQGMSRSFWLGSLGLNDSMKARDSSTAFITRASWPNGSRLELGDTGSGISLRVPSSIRGPSDPLFFRDGGLERGCDRGDEAQLATADRGGVHMAPREVDEVAEES